MKVSWQLFIGLSLFYVLMTVIYWQVGGEPVGIGGMLLAAALAGMVGFYVWFTQRRIGQILPEDNMTALISDGAGDLGFYSPHSWWPLPVALSMCALTLSLIIGWWLTVISLGALVISIIGMVTEYEKPATVSAH
ncbi:putative cytochrome c oxidase polypeptide 4 [Actinomycetes bacterium]|nr:probable cytochrome c oxidase polypeptide 4 [Actinomycetota bacterium]GDX21518.1 putative cytochrome c oxidase polypeptide 4 [Actinomycetes bacterium]